MTVDGDDKISGDLVRSSKDHVTVTGSPTLGGSIVIRKSQLKPRDKSRAGGGLMTLCFDHAAQNVSNVFDGGYFQTRQNPLYSSDSEQLDDDQHQDGHSW